MNSDPRYQAVDNALPEILPAVTREQIMPYYERLIKAFGQAKDMPVGVAEARGNRPASGYYARARRCWASSKPSSGHGNGWGRMIHDASHIIFSQRHPHARSHDGGHATLEREMAEYVMLQGWLVPKPPKEAPSPDAVRAAKREALQARLARWQTKHKRATTAIKKIERKLKRMQ